METTKPSPMEFRAAMEVVNKVLTEMQNELMKDEKVTVEHRKMLNRVRLSSHTVTALQDALRLAKALHTLETVQGRFVQGDTRQFVAKAEPRFAPPIDDYVNPGKGSK